MQKTFLALEAVRIILDIFRGGLEVWKKIPCRCRYFWISLLLWDGEKGRLPML